MNNFENKEEIKFISNEIWKLFESLRGAIPIEDYNVILLLLSGFKDEILNEFDRNDTSDIQNLIIDSFTNDIRYREVIEIYAPIIKFIPDEKLIELFHLLHHIEGSIFKEHFPQIFDTLIYKLSDAQGKYTGEYIQPLEITRFIMNLANLTSNDTVYNPFAGLASFATFLNPSQRYYGQEINHKTWALGYLRLLAHNLEHFDYTLEDSIENWNRFSEFDLIVCNPPFNLKANNRPFNHHNFSLESMIIENSLQQLNHRGELICVFPQSFLFKKNNRDFEFKKYLIENNLINTIIGLPTGIFKHTAIGTCIVIINKKKVLKNKIRLIDATTFVNSKSNNRDKIFDDLSLIEQIENKNKKHIRLVEKETIIENDYNLLVSRYFIEDNFKGVQLKDISSFIRGARSEKDKIGKIVKIKNLKDDIVSFSLDIDTVEEREIPGLGIRKIEQDCLLVALRWRTLKPTYFNYKGEPIYISNDILAIKIDKKLININYLINELHADYVLNQINSLRLNSFIPTLRREDFFLLKIKMLSIDEQNKKYIKEADQYLKNIILESIQVNDKTLINVEDENSFLRHQIAGTLKNVRGAYKFIQQILEEKVKPEFPEIYNLKANEALNSTLKTYLDIVERDLNSITKSVNQVGDKIELMDLKVEYFNLLEFMNDYYDVLLIRGKNHYNVSLFLDEDAIKEDGFTGVMINGDKDIIRKMLDNIIENAVKHAFTNSINEDFKNNLKIELLYDFKEFNVQINISNTGTPLPKGLSLDAVTRRGSSSGDNAGDGIGLWYVNEVMKIHNGNFNFTDETGSDENDGVFVTTMELTFPIIPAI